jgi:hypothetical protein
MKKLSVLSAMFILWVVIGMLAAVAQPRDVRTPSRVFPDDVVRIGSPFPVDDDEDGDDEGSDVPLGLLCDPNRVTCSEPPPECPPGEVPFVDRDTGCWGGCYNFWDCSPIPCVEDDYPYPEPEDNCPARTRCQTYRWPAETPSPPHNEWHWQEGLFCDHELFDCAAEPSCGYPDPSEGCEEYGYPSDWIWVPVPGDCWIGCVPRRYCEPKTCICNAPPDAPWPCTWGEGCPWGHICVPFNGDPFGGGSGDGMCVHWDDL